MSGRRNARKGVGADLYHSASKERAKPTRESVY
jgi:hypothetical protein